MFDSRVPHQAEDWFASLADGDLKKAANMQHAVGFFQHGFLPADDGSAVLALWESREECTAQEIQEFIDGPARLCGDALTSRAYQTLSSAVTPPSCWPKEPEDAKETAGSFFWVRHEYLEGCAPEGCSYHFWTELLAGTYPFFETPHPNLLQNHYFLPSGPSEGDPMFSVWETREPMSVEEFEAFIDGPNSPTAGTCSNAVHRVASGFGIMPSAAFPRRSFMGSAMMPLMDDSMFGIFGSGKLPFPLTFEHEPHTTVEDDEPEDEEVDILDYVIDNVDIDDDAMFEKVNDVVPFEIPPTIKPKVEKPAKLAAKITLPTSNEPDGPWADVSADDEIGI